MVLPEWKGTNAKGRETRELILRSALSVLVDEGFRAISMRRVAAKSGIEFGNLTYHYPSREALITELLNAVFRAYDVAGDQIKQHRHLPPEERLVEMCNWVAQEIGVKQTAHLMPELWALSNHDPFVAARLDELYRSGVRPIVELIEEMRPDLEPDAHLALGMFVSVSLESMLISAGYKKPFAPWSPAFATMAAKSFVHLVKSITSKEIGALPPIRSLRTTGRAKRARGD